MRIHLVPFFNFGIKSGIRFEACIRKKICYNVDFFEWENIEEGKRKLKIKLTPEHPSYKIQCHRTFIRMFCRKTELTWNEHNLKKNSNKWQKVNCVLP